MDRKYWETQVVLANITRKALDDKPEELKIGYQVSPGGILNAYREGDLSFNEATEALESWHKAKRQIDSLYKTPVEKAPILTIETKPTFVEDEDEAFTIWFSVDHQQFRLNDYWSKEEAEIMMKNLRIALDKLSRHSLYKPDREAVEKEILKILPEWKEAGKTYVDEFSFEDMTYEIATAICNLPVKDEERKTVKIPPKHTGTGEEIGWAGYGENRMITKIRELNPDVIFEEV